MLKIYVNQRRFVDPGEIEEVSLGRLGAGAKCSTPFKDGLYVKGHPGPPCGT